MSSRSYPQPPKLIVILGPTASGKSDLAVKLAKKINGEIISADSRQVYQGMDIGSGKITKKEMAGIPHYLLDMASPKKIFTVAQYKKLADKAIKKIQQKNKIPILCGGTGFYIQAVVDNLGLPEVKPDAKLRAQLEKKTTTELYQQLKNLDKRRAQNIDKNNRRRLIRALEIVIKTGKPVPPPSSFVILAKAGIHGLDSCLHRNDILQIGIKKSKEDLKNLIAKRLEKRLKQGMIQEVQKLKKAGLSWKRLEGFGLEYCYVAQYLQGKITEKEMKEKIQKASEQYARRQMTWFKRDQRIHWISNFREAEKSVKEFL